MFANAVLAGHSQTLLLPLRFAHCSALNISYYYVVVFLLCSFLFLFLFHFLLLSHPFCLPNISASFFLCFLSPYLSLSLTDLDFFWVICTLLITTITYHLYPTFMFRVTPFFLIQNRISILI